MVKKAYSIETKLAYIEMKKAGKSHQVIMETLGIKNVSQVRLGICRGDDDLIEQGLVLLRLTDENDLVAILEAEAQKYR